jgi:hypothetical protein
MVLPRSECDVGNLPQAVSGGKKRTVEQSWRQMPADLIRFFGTSRKQSIVLDDSSLSPIFFPT